VIIAFIAVSVLNAVMEEKGMRRAMGMKSKRAQEAEATDVRFSDMKGVNEDNAKLEEIVEYLKTLDELARLSGKLPRGEL